MNKVKIFINNTPYGETSTGLFINRPELNNKPIAIARVIRELIDKMEVSLYTNDFDFIKKLKQLLWETYDITPEFYINNDKNSYASVITYFKK